VSDIDGDGIPDIVEIIAGTNLLDPDDAKGLKAIKDVTGAVIDTTEQVVESVGGQAAVDAVGEIVDNVLEGQAGQTVSMRLPEEPPARRVERTEVRDDATVDDFLANVLAQVGDRYQRGVDNSLRDANPSAWDGSELVEWGANRAGSMVNDGAQNQYKQMVRHDGDMSVDVALVTPGAVLYEFTGDPNGSAKPTRASTAISLGDGKHIIDIDPIHGVRIVEAKDFTFTHAGVMPGFVDSHNPGPMSHALVEDALEAAGLEPGPALHVVTAPAPPLDPDTTAPTAKGQPSTESTDRGQGGPEDSASTDDAGSQSSVADEAGALEARAGRLRAEMLERQANDRADEMDRFNDLLREQAEANAGKESAEFASGRAADQAEESRVKAVDLDRRANEAELAGDTAQAAELREDAAVARASAARQQTVSERAQADVARLQDLSQQKDTEVSELARRYKAEGVALKEAEKVIDQIEAKAQHLRDSEVHHQRSVELESEAAILRDQGKTVEADAKHVAAQHARDAQQAEVLAASQPIDEAGLSEAGLLGGPTGTDATDAGDGPQSRLDDVTGADTTNAEVTATETVPDDTDAPEAPAESAGPSAEPDIDATVADAPPAEDDDLIDAHAMAAFLVPDLPDASPVEQADRDLSADEAPPIDNNPTPDLDA
jgi:hypothetical protein